jgi:hypothetical protein
VLNPTSCSRLGSIKSEASLLATTIIFRNQSSSPVVVSWIDFEGNPANAAMVGPGQDYLVATFVTHAWLVETMGGSCIAIYEPRPVPGVAVID